MEEWGNIVFTDESKVRLNGSDGPMMEKMYRRVAAHMHSWNCLTRDIMDNLGSNLK